MNGEDIDKVVTKVKRCGRIDGGNRRFIKLYKLAAMYGADISISNIGELNMAITRITESILHLNITDSRSIRHSVTIAVCNEAIKEFLDTTPLKGGVIDKAIRITETVNDMYAKINM